MSLASLGYEFENLLKEIFLKLDFEIEKEVVIDKDKQIKVDFACRKNDLSTWIELKFYRDDRISNGILQSSV